MLSLRKKLLRLLNTTPNLTTSVLWRCFPECAPSECVSNLNDVQKVRNNIKAYEILLNLVRVPTGLSHVVRKGEGDEEEKC